MEECHRPGLSDCKGSPMFSVTRGSFKVIVLCPSNSDQSLIPGKQNYSEACKSLPSCFGCEAIQGLSLFQVGVTYEGRAFGTPQADEDPWTQRDHGKGSCF